MKKPIAIAVHGGAGDLPIIPITSENKKLYQLALKEAIVIGYEILNSGGTALDAVEASVRVLEDDPLFNAGTGASYTLSGTHELDASIMCGQTYKIGAVTCVKNVKNPVILAHMVLKEGKAVFLCSDAAYEFAKECGLEMMPDEYFQTKERLLEWMEAKDNDFSRVDYGTAGAVALDSRGNLAAATSSGGLTNETDMRIGDVPVIGAGTYADNRSCAVSCSGNGDYILRHVAAHEVACLVKYKNLNIKEANKIIMKQLSKYKCGFGIVSLDPFGNVNYLYNTARMYRAWKTSAGEEDIKLF